MGSSLDEEYSVTCVATKVAWYSPCIRWSSGGAIGRTVGKVKYRFYVGCVEGGDVGVFS